MGEQEQAAIGPLKYQLRQWRELVNMYLPHTDEDRDDVIAIEQLIQTGMEADKLVVALKEIAKGQQPIDYAKPLVTIERLQGLATEVLVARSER